MGRRKTVSLRVDEDDLEAVSQAGLAPSDVMREALHARAAALRAEAWLAASRGARWKLPKGSPRSEDLIRAARDRR